MPSSRFNTALLMIFFLIFGPSPDARPAPPACLGKKDAKHVRKAKDPSDRILLYTLLAQRNATTLWSCLYPWGNVWPEGGTAGQWPPNGSSGGGNLHCQGVQDMLASLDCVEQGIREELPAWRQVRMTADTALGKAREQLEKAESALGYAADDAQRPVLELPPTVSNQIKSKRREFEDLESEISALVPARSPPRARP